MYRREKVIAALEAKSGRFAGYEVALQDTFTYTIDDGNGGTDTALVSVLVNATASQVDTLIVHDALNGVAETNLHDRPPDTVNDGSRGSLSTNNWVNAGVGAISADGDSADWGSQSTDAASIDCGSNADIKIETTWYWEGANGVSTGSPALILQWRASPPASGHPGPC